MASSKYRIAEQVLLRLTGGRPDASSPVSMGEIMLAVGQLANAMLKVSFYNEVLPNGDRMPNGTMVATYPPVPVVAHMNVSKATLPAMPISLMRDMGVFEVGSVDDVFAQFIPFQASDFQMFGSQHLSELKRQVGYKREGFDIIFTKNLLERIPDPITSVVVKLLVLDMDTLGDLSPLPLPADMEAAIIEQLFAQFAGKALKVNPNTDIIDTENGK